MQPENVLYFHLNFLDIIIITMAMITKTGITMYHNSRAKLDLLEVSCVIF